jgi:hypothetical protein
MALGVFAVTQIGRRTVFGDRRVAFLTLTPTDNYETGGLVFTPTMAGMNDIDFVTIATGAASDNATALVGKYNAATGKIFFYESGAANAALAEKSNAEAFPTGFTVQVMVVGH